MAEFLMFIGALVLGLALGTVVASLALRIPLNRPLLAAPSCSVSGERLSAADYIPIWGFFHQRGVCRHCGKALPRWFPLVEGSMALLTVLSLLVSDSPERFLIYTGYMAILLLIVAIDARLHEIYTVVLVVGSALALLAAFVLPEINLSSALVGAALGGAVFGVFYLLARAIYKMEALGFGDVLLAILLGLISGFPGVISSIFWGPILGGLISVVLLIAGRKGLRDYFPYAPGLCIAQMAFVLTHLSDEPLLDMLRLPVLGSILELLGKIIVGLIGKVFGG